MAFSLLLSLVFTPIALSFVLTTTKTTRHALPLRHRHHFVKKLVSSPSSRKCWDFFVTPSRKNNDYSRDYGNAFVNATKIDQSEDQELFKYYRRDYRDDSNETVANMAGLKQLLSQRFKARRNKNSLRGESDRVVQLIDDRLQQEHGVRVYDTPSIWTRLEKPPPAHLRNQFHKRITKLKKLYGPRGHPYQQVGQRKIDPILCPLSMHEIHDLLCRLTLCRIEKHSEKADAIQFELMVHGIRIHEELLQWTADRDHKFDSVTSSEDSFPVPPEHPAIYQKDDCSAPLTESQFRLEQRIKHLVEMRAEALFLGDEEQAHFLTLELYETYNVGVDDKSCTYSVGCKFSGDAQWDRPVKANASFSGPTLRTPQIFPPLLFGLENRFQSPQYRCSENSTIVNDADTMERVKTLVQERIHKREENKFREADAIRNELWHTYVSAKTKVITKNFNCLRACANYAYEKNPIRWRLDLRFRMSGLTID